MSQIKVKEKTIKRTNIGFPTLWEAKTENDEILCLHFRYGELTIYKCESEEDCKDAQKELIETRGNTTNGKSVFREFKDEFSLDGSMSDEDLLILLKKHECILNEEVDS